MPGANRSIARLQVLRTALLCLLAWMPSRPAGAWGLEAKSSEPTRKSYGFEIGPTVSLPLPAASAHRDEIGLDVGVSCTDKSASTMGVGLDVAYHYWPVSAEFKNQFNELLRDGTLNILELGDGTWGLQVLELSGHLRIVRAAMDGARPWLQVGVGAYRVDPHTSGYSGDAGFFTVSVAPLSHSIHPGISVAAGADPVGGPHARMGVNATYYFVNCHNHYGENLQIFTLGVHAVFGW